MHLQIALLYLLASSPAMVVTADICNPGSITFCNDADMQGDCQTVDIVWKDCFLIPDPVNKADSGSSYKVSTDADSICELWEGVKCNGGNSETPLRRIMDLILSDNGHFMSYRCYADQQASEACWGL